MSRSRVRIAELCDDIPRATAGQSVVEYGLIVALIVCVVLLSMNAFGQQVMPWFASLAARVTTTGT